MRKFVLALWIAGMLAVTGGAYAAPEYYEAFDYPAGHFTYQHGWVTQPSSLPYAVIAPGATYTDDGGNALQVRGNLVYQTVDNAHYDHIARSLNSLVTALMSNDGTYYVTALISQENLVGFKQPGTSRGIAIHAEPAGAGTYTPTLEVYDSAGAGNYLRLPGFITDADYHLYALRVINRLGADEITVLIDPDLTNPQWDTARGSRLRIEDIDFQGSYSQIYLWGGAKGPNTGAYTEYWIGGTDEIRIASTWAEAAPYSHIPQPGSGTLSGQVELPNFTIGSSPVAVVVELILSGAVVRSETVLLDLDGSYSISAVDPGTYDVAFKAASWIPKTVSGVVVVDANKICNVTLTNGDVDGDNDLTDADHGIVIPNIDMKGDP